MKNFNLIQLVKKLLMFSDLGMAKKYQETKNILKQKYTDEMVLSTIDLSLIHISEPTRPY